MKVLLPSIAIGSFLATVPAFAAMPAQRLPASPPVAENIRADCHWVDNKWTYRKGDKVLVCRPDRPRGAGWIWFREGNRTGWYHRGRKEWDTHM